MTAPIVPVFSNGPLMTSSLNALADVVRNQIAPGWTAYTPVWTSTGVAPAIGNGTLAGRYRREPSSDLVILEFIAIFGSTTTFGSGVYRFSVPSAVASSGSVQGIGAADIFDSGTTERCAIAKFLTSTTFTIMSPTGEVSSVNPWTWALNDQIRCTMIYQPA